MLNTLCPIRNFAVLKEGYLYRGAQPLYSYEYKWLVDRGVRHLVNLRSEKKIDDRFSSLFESVMNIPVADHCLPSMKDVKRFVHMVRNYTEIFFHCEHGRGRTSTFAVIARLTMGWRLSAALTEEKEKFGYSFQHPSQLKFLENLDISSLK